MFFVASGIESNVVLQYPHYCAAAGFVRLCCPSHAQLLNNQIGQLQNQTFLCITACACATPLPSAIWDLQVVHEDHHLIIFIMVVINSITASAGAATSPGSSWCVNSWRSSAPKHQSNKASKQQSIKATKASKHQCIKATKASKHQCIKAATHQSNKATKHQSIQA